MASTLNDARAIDTSSPACTLRKAHNSTRSMVVSGLERVLETGHVYRAESHASSRHLCEYDSLDFEMGFIEDLRDVIELEREILEEMLDDIRAIRRRA